jgi:hypothetical protein
MRQNERPDALDGSTRECDVCAEDCTELTPHNGQRLCGRCLSDSLDAQYHEHIDRLIDERQDDDEDGYGHGV